MGWAVAQVKGRWIGYGVPAVCDHPSCDVAIDRGLSYRCGDLDDDEGCGLFFCGDHRPHFVGDEDRGGAWVCDRCAHGHAPFEEKPDTPGWIRHQLTDESWAEWRKENPLSVEVLRGQLRQPFTLVDVAGVLFLLAVLVGIPLAIFIMGTEPPK